MPARLRLPGRSWLAVALAALAALAACTAARSDERPVITVSGSALGTEGTLLRRQVTRFMVAHPDIVVRVQPTPDDATQRHQLFVQWLNAHVGDPDVLRRELLRMAEKTASRLRAAGQLARTVTLTVRWADFTTITRSATLPTPSDLTADLHGQATTLFDRLLPLRQRVRLVGVRAERLVAATEAHVQPSLDAPDLGWREAEQAIDQAVARFGAGAVRRAALTREADRREAPADPQRSSPSPEVPSDRPDAYT